MTQHINQCTPRRCATVIRYIAKHLINPAPCFNIQGPFKSIFIASSRLCRKLVDITRCGVNLIYPLRCASCGVSLHPLDGSGVCASCVKTIRPNPAPYCKKCGRTTEDASRLCGECRKIKFYFDSARSACIYDGALKELIHLFKYNGRTALGGILSKLMIDFINRDSGILAGTGMITFVPLHRRRLRERGFNQSKTLACNISKEFNIPVSDTLEKTISTRHQNELARDERLKNLCGVFRAGKGAGQIKNLNILLIDDVMTTGATLSECSKALLDAGAKSVRCLTLARGLSL